MSPRPSFLNVIYPKLLTEGRIAVESFQTRVTKPALETFVYRGPIADSEDYEESEHDSGPVGLGIKHKTDIGTAFGAECSTQHSLTMNATSITIVIVPNTIGNEDLDTIYGEDNAQERYLRIVDDDDTSEHPNTTRGELTVIRKLDLENSLDETNSWPLTNVTAAFLP